MSCAQIFSLSSVAQCERLSESVPVGEGSSPRSKDPRSSERSNTLLPSSSPFQLSATVSVGSEDLSYPRALLDVLSLQKLTLELRESPQDTAIFRIWDSESGDIVANLYQILESTSGRPWIQNICVMTDTNNKVLMLVSMPLYNETPEIFVTLGGNENAVVGIARSVTLEAPFSYELEVHDSVYATFKGPKLGNRFTATKTDIFSNDRRLARIKLHSRRALPRQYSIYRASFSGRFASAGSRACRSRPQRAHSVGHIRAQSPTHGRR